jgi:hypothetical protein
MDTATAAALLEIAETSGRLCREEPPRLRSKRATRTSSRPCSGSWTVLSYDSAAVNYALHDERSSL